MLCDYCGGEIGNSDSCNKPFVYFNGEPEDRIKNYSPKPCDDCGIKTLGYHHVGCHNEECPFCGGLIQECYCEISFEIC